MLRRRSATTWSGGVSPSSELLQLRGARHPLRQTATYSTAASCRSCYRPPTAPLAYQPPSAVTTASLRWASSSSASSRRAASLTATLRDEAEDDLDAWTASLLDDVLGDGSSRKPSQQTFPHQHAATLGMGGVPVQKDALSSPRASARPDTHTTSPFRAAAAASMDAPPEKKKQPRPSQTIDEDVDLINAVVNEVLAAKTDGPEMRSTQAANDAHLDLLNDSSATRARLRGMVFDLSMLPAPIQAQWDPEANTCRRATAVASTSNRMSHWRCLECRYQYKRTVRRQVQLDGICPECAMTASSSSTALPASVAELAPVTKAPRPVGSVPRAQTIHDLKHLHGRDLSPMLAYGWQEFHARYKDSDRLYASPKLDGVRCVVVLDPKSNAPVFLSRNGNVLECGDWIASALRPVFERDPTTVLDGELYNHEVHDFNTLLSGIRSQRATRSTDAAAVQRKLQFHVFDVLYAKGLSTTATFPQRLAAIERALAALPPASTERVKAVEFSIIRKRDVPAALETALSNGYEGLMLRAPENTYHFGKRSTTLLKVKKMFDAEYTIVDVIEGTGRLVHAVGAIQCVTDKRHNFKVAFSVTDEQRRIFWKYRNQLLLGKRATVRYQELTPRGVPRFGIFKAVRSDAKGAGFV